MVETNESDESARKTLIEIATRLTDRTALDGTTEDWLRTFRRNYRHMATTYGLAFTSSHVRDAEAATDQTLDAKP